MKETLEISNRGQINLKSNQSRGRDSTSQETKKILKGKRSRKSVSSLRTVIRETTLIREKTDSNSLVRTSTRKMP